MNFESLHLFLLILAPFFIIFLLEAVVLFFFRFRLFLGCLGVSILVNLVSIALLYFIASPIVGLFGYDTAQFNGLNLQPQVIAFLWWFSTIVEAILLQLIWRKTDRKRIYTAAIVMNLLSFLFFYGFVELSH